MFGVDIGAAVEQGWYVALDVVEAIAEMMRDGMPDPDLWKSLISSFRAR
jgi:hypothetical protein